MALTLETGLRNALADAIDTAVNVGAGTSTLVIETSADGALATFNLQDPAFDAAGTGGIGVIQLQGTTLSDTNANAGTAAQFSIYDGNALKQLEGTVNTAGADINISSVAIGAGDTVNLTSFSITVP